MEPNKPFIHPSYYPGETPEAEHPLSLYMSVWILLFVLSAFSYMVDYMNVEGYLRAFLTTSVLDHHFCFSQSRPCGRSLHAHGLGENGFNICHYAAPPVFAGPGWDPFG